MQTISRPALFNRLCHPHPLLNPHLLLLPTKMKSLEYKESTILIATTGTVEKPSPSLFLEFLSQEKHTIKVE